MPTTQLTHDSRRSLQRQRKQARENIKRLNKAGLLERHERTRLLAAIDRRYHAA